MTEKLTIDNSYPLDTTLPDTGELSFTNSETLPTTENTMVAKRALDSLESKSMHGERIHPKETVIGDGDHIEGQLLNFIKTNRGTELSFKLTQPAYEQIEESLPLSSIVTDSELGYISTNSEGESTVISPSPDAYTLKSNDLNITITKPDTEWRSLRNLVNITMPETDSDGDKLTNEQIGAKLDFALSNLLGIEDAFIDPNFNADKLFKEARYKWHHCIDEDSHSDHIDTGNLIRKDVFPGYSTVIEDGKHLEYEQKYGRFGVFHRIIHPSNLPNILKYGLMSTQERLTRGIGGEGLSTMADLKSGGADNVFTRTITEESVSTKRNDPFIYNDTTLIALNPNITDRTDWFSYDDDKMGSVDPAIFKQRLSPDKLFESLNKSGYRMMSNNEQMYRTGISSESIAGIITQNSSAKRSIVLQLKREGFTEFNNQPIEDFVHVATRMSQVIDVSNGEPPRQKFNYSNRVRFFRESRKFY